MKLVRRWCKAKDVDTGMTFILAGHKYRVGYAVPASLSMMIYAKDLTLNENVSIRMNPESVLEVTYFKAT